MSDYRLGKIEEQLTAMGLADVDVAAFTTAYELADEAERVRLWSLGDARIIEEIRALRREAAIAGADVSDDPFDGGDIEIIDPEQVDVDDILAVEVVEPAGVTMDDTADDGGPSHELDAMTVAQVLAWVGDDPQKAGVALEYERDFETPRTSLIQRLEKLADF